jgi:glycosyltransferase involved in cell wall biosynthesis
MNVSVVLASFNGEKYIQEQLNSILQELHFNDEFIITDDGSTDGTVAMIDKFRNVDSRIVLLQGPGKGFVKNFEFGVKQVTKEIIILADQDDIWLPGRRDEVVKEFAKNHADLVLVSGKLVDENLNPIEDGNDRFEFKSGFWQNFWKNRFTGNFMAFKSDFRSEFLPFPRKLDYHDSWIGLMACLEKKKIIYIDKKFILFRRHDKVQSGKRRNIFKIMWSRIVLLSNLMLRKVKFM